uniref:Ig-like domain-containing protein n=1 Tax=Sphenodon punctatus TaxID=8508 RepID=A0A8D0GL42_SPHPU
MALSTAMLAAFVLVIKGTSGNSITQTEGTVFVPEGKSLHVECTYEKTGSQELFWYIQYPNQALQLLVRQHGTPDDEEERKRRRGFSAESVKENKSFHLTKYSSEVSDSAVYYCAMRDTMRGNARGAVQK